MIKALLFIVGMSPPPPIAGGCQLSTSSDSISVQVSVLFLFDLYNRCPFWALEVFSQIDFFDFCLT